MPFSKAAWMEKLEKLEIKRGDILLVSHPEVAEELMRTPAEFQVPIIMDYTRSGIKKLTRQQLLDALDQLDLIDEQNAKSAS